MLRIFFISYKVVYCEKVVSISIKCYILKNVKLTVHHTFSLLYMIFDNLNYFRNVYIFMYYIIKFNTFNIFISDNCFHNQNDELFSYKPSYT